jgi:glycine/D-amino acid oxidase-like deaminating enzyme
MKVLVPGSGVIGVAVAYYLARAGHEVEVVERQPGPVLETGFGNAGEVSPGYSAPRAGPGVPLKAIKWMLMQHSPLVIWPMLDPAMRRWGAMMLANCTAKAYALNKVRLPSDETGDCFLFGNRLAEMAQALGVKFRFDAPIEGISREAGCITGVRTGDGMLAAIVTRWRWAASRRSCWRRWASASPCSR